jgi:hypothetical protein
VEKGFFCSVGMTEPSLNVACAIGEDREKLEVLGFVGDETLRETGD